jgi:outer membrane protein TolC
MRIVRITLLLFLATLVPSWGQTLQLDSCYEKAKRNYPLIKQYQLIEKALEYNLSNANKSYLPQISLTGIAGYIIKGLPSQAPAGSETSDDKFQFIGIAQLNQTIYDGGVTHAQKEIIQTTSQVQKAETDVALFDIRKRVNDLYFSIMLMDEQLELLNVLTNNLNLNLKAVKLSNDNGLAYSSDVDEVKVEILKTEQRQAEIRFAREGYLNMLSLLIGEPLNENVKLEKPILTTLEEGASIDRPELSLYQFQRNIISARQALTRTGYIPKIGLLGAGITIQPGVDFGLSKLNSMAIAGLSVSWNTNSLYKSSNEKALAKINSDQINVQEETFLFNTKLQLTQQRSEVAKQRTIVAKDDEIVTLKSGIKKAYELKYKNGMCTMNDLILVTNGESEARSNKALHEAQLLMSIYSYKTTSGND